MNSTNLDNIINTVIQGDCLEVMQLIPDKSIDCIVCDLPYGITACDWDVLIPLTPLWSQYTRISKLNSPIVLFATQPFASLLVSSKKSMFRYEWIWNKGRGNNFQLANKRPMQNHEQVLIFSKKQPIYYPQYWYSTPYHRPAGPKNPTLGLRRGSSAGSYHSGTNCLDGKRFPLSILDYPRQPNNLLHSTEKPVALLEYLIKTYTLPREVVLDNCCGSGSTLVAAKRTNRNYIGIELNSEFAELSRDRLAGLEVKKAGTENTSAKILRLLNRISMLK